MPASRCHSNEMMNHILIIQLRQVGDVVLTTPIARIIKTARPGTRVAFLTESPSDQLLRGNPYIDDLIISNRKDGLWGTLKMAARLRRRKFDALVDYMSNPRSALLSFGSRAPIRVSYPKKMRGMLYTHQVAPHDGYAVDYKKDLLTPLSIQSDWRRPEIFLSDEEKGWGYSLREQLLAGARRLITVDPSHRRATRRWPARHYGRLCRLIGDRFQARAVVLWGPGEESVAAEVVASSGRQAVLAPATDLRQSASLTAAADAHLGNCSAPRHIAVAVGTPSFTILGATSLGWAFPSPKHANISRGLACQPCNLNHCEIGIICLADFPAEKVFQDFAEWVQGELGWTSP
jgi:heptosyltransferase-2/heptosyltransferase-3